MNVHEVYLDGNFMPIIQDVQKLYCRTVTFKRRANRTFSRVKETLLREKGPIRQWCRSFISDPD